MKKKEFRKSVIPKVLVAAPTSDRHKHLLKEWMESLNNLNYPNFDVMLVDTSETDSYLKLLKKQKVNGKDLILDRMEWDPDKDNILQFLAYVRERIRKYFIENEYDFLFFLDDDIFIPKWGIERLLSYNKDCVGFYVHIYDKAHRKPCIFKSGNLMMGYGLDLFKFKEINEYKKFVKKFRKDKLTKEEKNLIPFLIEDLDRPQLLKVYATGIGCLMINKKVLREVPFRTNRRFVMGEDLWFFNEANDKKFEFYVDTDVRAIHKNTNWNMIHLKNKKDFKFFIAQGPVEATQAVRVVTKGRKK